MPTVADVALELAEVVAWLNAWKGSEPEVLPEARGRCLTILNETWDFLFPGERVPRKSTKIEPEALAVQLRQAKGLLEKDSFDKTTVRDILANVIAFFQQT